MKTFEEFSADMVWASHTLWLEEKKRKSKEELEKRRSDAYQKKQRQKKIRKLAAMDSHWKGLS